LLTPSAAPTPAFVPDLLVVDAGADLYLPVLGNTFRVVSTSRASAAFEHLTRTVPAVMVADLDGIDGAPIDLIVQARTFSMPPAILVTTAEPSRVPDAMVAGCDSVLLKPFAPNLIYSRLSRMIRMRQQMLRHRSAPLRERASRSYAKSVHLHERGDLLSAGYLRDWPTTQCAYCDHEGVTSFEYASHRHAWYACLACKKVWMAKRRD
jgi:DNA-binding response OmpR family regulator